MSQIEEAKKKLLDALLLVIPPCDPTAVEETEALIDAIEGLIDAKIADLRDEINERGIYSRDF